MKTLESLQTCRYKQHRPVIVAVQSIITEPDNKKEHWGDFSEEEASWELLDSPQNYRLRDFNHSRVQRSTQGPGCRLTALARPSNVQQQLLLTLQL